MHQPEDSKKTKSPPKPYRWLRRMLRVLAILVIFVMLLLVFIRSPWGQNIIKDRLVSYVSGKTETKVDINKLFITFDGNLQLNGLFLEDKQGDTLIYSKSLEANLPLWQTIKGERYGLDQLKWEGLKANIIREDTTSGYNFQFLIDAFASEEETPKTSQEPVNLTLGEINLKDFNITYIDKVSGIDSKIIIGNFFLKMKTTDIKNKVFETEEITLENSEVKFHLNATSTPDESDTADVLPDLSIGQLRLNNVKTDIQTPDLTAKTHVVNFYSEIPKIDLTNEQYAVNTIQLQDSDVFINITDDKSPQNSPDTTAFQWPKMQLEIPEVVLKNNHLTYTINNAQPVSNEINADAVDLQNLTLQLNDFVLKDETAGLNINQFKFKSYSGIQLKKLKGNFSVNNQQILIDDIDFHLNRNRITGRVELKYSDLNNFLEQPEKAGLKTDISNLDLSIKDLLKFQPQLADNAYLKTLSKEVLKTQFKASGSISDLNISNFKMNWGQNTQISTTASIQNITDMDALRFDLQNYSITTKRSSIVKFIDESQLGICLPTGVELTGQLKGTLKNISTKSSFKSSQGIISVKGNFSNEKGIAYNSSLNIKDYKLNELLDNPQLGQLNLEFNSNGSGQDIKNLNAELDLLVSAFDFNGYTYEGLKLNGSILNGKGDFSSNYKDSNLNFKLDTSIELDSIKTIASVNLGLKGANLSQLGLMQRDIKTGFDLKLDFSKIDDTYSLKTDITDGLVIYDNKSYQVGSINTSALISQDTTNIFVDNNILKLKLKTNTNPEHLSQSLSQHINSYLYKNSTETDTVLKPIDAQLNAEIAQSRLLNEVFLVNVKELDTIDVSMNYNSKKKTLNSRVTAPYINYSGNKIDSLKFVINTDKDKFDVNLGFKNINVGPIDLPRTTIKGYQNADGLSLDFKATRDDKTLYQMNASLSREKESLRFSIDKAPLILNANKWQVSATNEVLFKSDTLFFNEFFFNRKDQTVNFSDNIKGISKPHIGLEFNNFKMSEILNYLNPETKLVQGALNGHLIIEEPLNKTGFTANLNISGLEVLRAYLGQLNINASSADDNSYVFDASMKEGDVNLDLNGNYVSSKDSPNLNLDLRLNQVKIKALENLSMGEISEGKGSLNGNFNLQTDTGNFVYHGKVNFDNASFKVSQLNTSFSFPDETLSFDNEGLYMENFHIRDANKNLLSISGKVGTENILNPKFNLRFKAKDFKVLEATKEDNAAFYGKAIIDVDGTLKGDLQIPDLDADIKIDSETDFVYVLPPSTASIEKRDGVVSFVNRDNPDQILTKKDTKSGTITGFDINTFINIDQQAKFTILLDKNTGDNFQVQGKGDLNFQMLPNGRINLSGVYEATSGQYKLSLYNLVKRKFLLAPGSRITWNGDPFNANLDVSAIYNVEASAYALMSSQISGLSPSVKTKYRQVLPFEVYLNINGELLQPEISFELDMPEEERGAISGQVYSRIKQLNQQQSELSKQVFSLLVLNRFYPSKGNDGSSGGIQTLAQQNINDAISDQLNAFSDKILGKSGFELDFGLDSYTDYQGDGPTERTQLNVAAQKKLFNDRLTVRVGSEIDVDDNSNSAEATPVSGNVSLIYELTKDGRYRLKGFRKNRFENIIDGQTIVSGIALIFTKEFNKFEELWMAMLKSSNDNEKQDKDKSNTNTGDVRKTKN